MKIKYSLLVLALSILLMPFSSIAQRPNAPSLEIILSDNNPLQISINGRLFKNVSRKLQIKDLPARRNHIEIIRYCTESDAKKCKKRVVFSGDIKFRKNVNYQAVVLVDENKLRLADDGSLFLQNTQPHYNQAENNLSNTNNNEIEEIVALKKNASKDLMALGSKMKKYNDDEKRLIEANKYVSTRQVRTNELKIICSWLMFDETKLQFLNNAYKNTLDKDNYNTLVDVFTIEKSKSEFQSQLDKQ